MITDFYRNHDKNLMFIFKNITTNYLYHSYAYETNPEYAKFYDNLSDENIETLILLERGKMTYNNLDETEWLFCNIAFLFIPTIIKKLVDFTKFSMRKRIYKFIDSEKFTSFLKAHNNLTNRIFLTEKDKQCLNNVFTRKDFRV